jgi:hypothetical protein
MTTKQGLNSLMNLRKLNATRCISALELLADEYMGRRDLMDC